MGTKWQMQVAALSTAAVVMACDEWPVWDDMFKRNAVGAEHRGWTGGDGAKSAELPNGREFWIFGDSPVTSWSEQGFRTELFDPNPFGPYVTFGNTIAVQNDRSNPSASGISFWARDGGANCGAPVNITQVAQSSTNFKQFFNHCMLGTLALNPKPANADARLWPVGAECLDCNDPSTARLLLSFYEWEPCNPGPGLNCSEHRTRYTGNVIARVRNLGGDPSTWTVDGSIYIPHNGTNSNLEETWGAAFVRENDPDDGNDFIYIYGHKPVGNIDLRDANGHLYVARSTEANLFNGNWQVWSNSFLVGPGWNPMGSPPFEVARDVGVFILSVDRVLRNDVPSYLLVHSRPELNHQVYVRTTIGSTNSSTTAASWPTVTITTPRLDVSVIDASAAVQIFDLIGRFECFPEFPGTLAPVWREFLRPERICGLTYHGHAHAELAIGDHIPISYIVPNGPNPVYFFDPINQPRTGAQDALFYRPKFSAIDMSKLKPWCQSDCWEGIVKEWPRRTVAMPNSFPVDVQNSPKVWGRLTRLVGSPTMRVEFYDGILPLGLPVQCQVSGSFVTCNNISKPQNADTAAFVVSGAQTDEYTLRVHYAGNY
jgi:hypothetical protein